MKSQGSSQRQAGAGMRYCLGEFVENFVLAAVDDA
jgi:hypothetical protein